MAPIFMASKFCDRRLVAAIIDWAESEGTVRWFTPESWLYFYSRADGITEVKQGADYAGGASFGLTIGEADHILADSPGADGGGLKRYDVLFLAANLRAGIEEMVA